MDAMKYNDLRDFLTLLEQQGELKRITLPVDPHLLSNRSRKPFGGSGSFRNANNLPTSRSAETSSCPMPIATRFGVPNRLHSTGIE